MIKISLVLKLKRQFTFFLCTYYCNLIDIYLCKLYVHCAYIYWSCQSDFSVHRKKSVYSSGQILFTLQIARKLILWVPGLFFLVKYNVEILFLFDLTELIVRNTEVLRQDISNTNYRIWRCLSYFKGSDWPCIVVELIMQYCGQIL